MKFDFVVDTREKAAAKKRAIKKYKETKLEALPAGDYGCRVQSNFKLLCERKSLEDFVNSMATKRLFRQAEKLHKNCEVVIIILEGKYETLRFVLQKLKLHFNEDAFWGTYCSLIIRDNFHIAWTPDTTHTMDMAYKLCKKMAEGKYKTKRRWKPKSLNTSKEMLETIPGVTEAISKRLINKYGSILNIALQNEQELCTVSGIGPRLSKRIIKSLG